MRDKVIKVLEKNLGKTVLVRLKNWRRLRGRLEGFDEHLNLVLRNTEDINDAANIKKLGSIILRGDNIVTILPPNDNS